MKKYFIRLFVIIFGVFAFLGVNIKDSQAFIKNTSDTVSNKKPLYLKHAKEILAKTNIILCEHYSHSSHESHYSHNSHYSHYSGR
jgi:hypothetical protein